MSFVKCADFSCPSRSNCWRFVAPTAAEQDFQDFRRPSRSIRCEHYMHVTDQQKRAGKIKVRVLSTD